MNDNKSDTTNGDYGRFYDVDIDSKSIELEKENTEKTNLEYDKTFLNTTYPCSSDIQVNASNNAIYNTDKTPLDINIIDIEKNNGQTVGMPYSQPVQKIIIVNNHNEFCNVYWVFFFLGIFINPFFLCGSFGLLSKDYNKRLAGMANFIGLFIYMSILIYLCFKYYT